VVATFRTIRAARSSPPFDCPRKVDGGIGPRVCEHRTCPNHVLHEAGARHGRLAARNLRVLMLLGNDCTDDIVDQHPEGMSPPLIALYLAITEQQARKVLRRILLKSAATVDESANDERKVRTPVNAWLARRR
jgi:hypothetical protein